MYSLILSKPLKWLHLARRHLPKKRDQTRFQSNLPEGRVTKKTAHKFVYFRSSLRQKRSNETQSHGSTVATTKYQANIEHSGNSRAHNNYGVQMHINQLILLTETCQLAGVRLMTTR